MFSTESVAGKIVSDSGITGSRISVSSLEVSSISADSVGRGLSSRETPPETSSSSLSGPSSFVIASSFRSDGVAEDGRTTGLSGRLRFFLAIAFARRSCRRSLDPDALLLLLERSEDTRRVLAEEVMPKHAS